MRCIRGGRRLAAEGFSGTGTIRIGHLDAGHRVAEFNTSVEEGLSGSEVQERLAQ